MRRTADEDRDKKGDESVGERLKGGDRGRYGIGSNFMLRITASPWQPPVLWLIANREATLWDDHTANGREHRGHF